jgi:hypothetical protein
MAQHMLGGFAVAVLQELRGLMQLGARLRVEVEQPTVRLAALRTRERCAHSA